MDRQGQHRRPGAGPDHRDQQERPDVLGDRAQEDQDDAGEVDDPGPQRSHPGARRSRGVEERLRRGEVPGGGQGEQRRREAGDADRRDRDGQRGPGRFEAAVLEQAQTPVQGRPGIAPFPHRVGAQLPEEPAQVSHALRIEQVETEAAGEPAVDRQQAQRQSAPANEPALRPVAPELPDPRPATRRRHAANFRRTAPLHQSATTISRNSA